MRTRDKRYAGDWLPKDRTAIKKGRARKRIKQPKSEMQLRSEHLRKMSI